MFKREQWGSQLGFILATTGSAVGLGNIWKFPYIAGENGGGAFVLVYLGCILLIGIPIFMSELFIGQKSQANVVDSFEKLDKKGSLWQICGWILFISPILVLAFYSVVGGWCLDFAFNSLMNRFSGMSQDQISSALGNIFANPTRQILWHAIFMGICMFVIYHGVQKGLERWNKILIPLLALILVGLFIKAIFLEGFGEALSFLFVPDFTKLTIEGVLVAIGHSFFTLSIALGTLLTYGSYLSTRQKLPKLAVTIGILDTAVALIAGVVVFSVVFSFGLEPEAGPTLIFATLPSLFVQMTGGAFLSSAFFVLVSLAAITSAVSILEVPVVLVSERFCIKRGTSTFILGGIVFLLGILCALSFNHLADFKIIGYNIFDLFDKATTNWLMPIAGMLIALFVGWKLKPSVINELLKQFPRDDIKWVFLWAIRIVAPVAVLIIMLNTIINYFTSG